MFRVECAKEIVVVDKVLKGQIVWGHVNHGERFISLSEYSDLKLKATEQESDWI